MEKINFNKPTFEWEHPIVKEGGKGTQKFWKFKNGYGASVVRFEISNQFNPKRKEPIGSYGVEKGLWEMAMVKFNKNDDTKNGKPSFEILYNTSITNDVIGNLNEEEVVRILKQISKLTKEDIIEGKI